MNQDFFVFRGRKLKKSDDPMEGIVDLILEFSDGSQRRVTTTLNMEIAYNLGLVIPEDCIYDFTRNDTISVNAIVELYKDDKGLPLNNINEFAQGFI